MAPMDPGPRYPRRRSFSESSLPLHERIRRRRFALNMAGQDLAERAGVSPAYISLIEKGVKIPSEEVAEAIAIALRDDPELYRAWAQSGRIGDMETAWARLHNARQYYRDASLRRQLASGADLPDELPAVPQEERGDAGPEAARVRGWIEASHRLSHDSGLLAIPVLEEGDDPGSGEIHPEAVVDVLRLDPRLLGGGPLRRPFAYCLGEDAIERVRDLFRPGDWVVLDSRPGELTADRVQAVRFKGRVLLSRVLAKRDSLLLLPSEGRSDVRVLDLGPGELLDRYIVGNVVLTIRGEGPPRE